MVKRKTQQKHLSWQLLLHLMSIKKNLFDHLGKYYLPFEYVCKTYIVLLILILVFGIDIVVYHPFNCVRLCRVTFQWSKKIHLMYSWWIDWEVVCFEILPMCIANTNTIAIVDINWEGGATIVSKQVFNTELFFRTTKHRKNKTIRKNPNK